MPLPASLSQSQSWQQIQVRPQLQPPHKRKQASSPGPVIIEISSGDEDSRHSPPPSKRHKSHTPVGNGWAGGFRLSNGSRDPAIRSRPLVQSTLPAIPPSPSRAAVNGAALVDIYSQRSKPLRWDHLSGASASASPKPHRDELDYGPRPSSSQKFVAVEIPSRPGSRGPEPPARRYGAQFPRRHQSSQANIEVRIPPSPRKAERRELLRELEQSTRVAIEKPDLVRRVFGQTGFSSEYSVEEDVEGMRKVASKKKKSAPSKDIPLDYEGGSLVDALQKLDLGKMAHPADSARQVLTSRFDEEIVPPLTFANDVNQRRLHGKFQFANRYILREGVKTAPPSTNSGCSCTECDSSTCLCFSKDVPDDVGKGKHREQIRTYVRRRDGTVVLSDEYIARELNSETRHFEVTECNELCACGPDCWNRVVAKGRTVPLEIFQTAKCGFGVRSSQDIVKGQFIELYLGEVITETELRRREDTAEEEGSSYIYSLDFFENSKGQKYHVDGQYFGSAMRFVNHSCNPNARGFTVQLHKGDKRVYNLAFFAIKDIKAGVEICIDYSPREWSGEASDPSGHANSQGQGQSQGHNQGDEELVRCHCGEKNCRKFLWPSSAKARRRRRRLDD